MDVDYDPQATNYSALLKMFWDNHDPTANCTRQVQINLFFFKGYKEIALENYIIFETFTQHYISNLHIKDYMILMYT